MSTSAARLSSAALALSGVGIAVDPRGATKALHLHAASARGLTETRAGVGGTFAALGAWALARGSRDAYTAVGVTWLGAAAVRLVSLYVDKPDTDATFWAYLAGEIGFGVAALTAGSRT